ncbi:antitoxin [Candidatus Woesearchaeota archaeon CG10_big_fil_rev_8_21_14_0_10_30_7]|nr:MAG: antitoxin [Candidatus Woesearchaeota archaeon CG10_big_fil_rev_8_21_14_0_10_30_7]
MTERIIIDPEILAGKPIIKGTRISVEFILELLSSGMNIKELLQEYPHLSRGDVLASLKYATGALRHEEVYPTAKIA